MSADHILTQLLGGGAASGFAGGLAGGLASGFLTSKAGRKLGKKALRVGGIAAVGGLAYAAWHRHRESQRLAQAGSAARAPLPEPVSLERFVPRPEQADRTETLGAILLRAMIAAAQSDGRLDAAERHALQAHIEALALSEPEKRTLRERLEEPIDLNTLVADARTPELAVEIYTASLLAIDVDTAAERAYLAMLAARLGLPESLVAQIHHEADAGIRAEGASTPRPAQP